MVVSPNNLEIDVHGLTYISYHLYVKQIRCIHYIALRKRIKHKV